MIKNILTNLVLHSPEDGKSGYSKERGREILDKVQKEEKLTAETAIEVFDFLINAEHKVDFFTKVQSKIKTHNIKQLQLAEDSPDLQNKLYEFNNTNIQNADIKVIQHSYKNSGIGIQPAVTDAEISNVLNGKKDVTTDQFKDTLNLAKNRYNTNNATPDARAPLGSEVRKKRMNEVKELVAARKKALEDTPELYEQPKLAGTEIQDARKKETEAELDAITKNAASNPDSSVKDRVAKLNAEAAKGNAKPTFTGNPKSRTPSPNPEDFGTTAGNVTEKLNKLTGEQGGSGSGGNPNPQPAPGPANNPLTPQTQNNPNSPPGQNLGLDDIPQGIVKQRREELENSGFVPPAPGNPPPLPPQAQNNPAGGDDYGDLPFPPDSPAAAPGDAGIGEDDANEQDIINNPTGGDDTESRKKRGFFGDFFSVANKGQFAMTFLLTGVALFAFPPAVPFFVTLLALQVVAQVVEKVLPVVFMAATALVAIAETVKNIPNIAMNLAKGLGQILTLGYYKPKYSEINYDATKASFSTLFNKDIDKGKDKDKDKDDTKEKGTNYSKAIGTAFAKTFAAVIGLPLAFAANLLGNTIMGAVNVLFSPFILLSKALLPPKFQMRFAPLNFDFTRNFVSNYITGNKDAAIARNEARKAEAKEQYMERKAKYEEKQQQKGLVSSNNALAGLDTPNPSLNAGAKSLFEEKKQDDALRKNIANLDKDIESQKQRLDEIDKKIQKEQDPNKKADLIAQRAKIVGQLEQNIDSKRQHKYNLDGYLETNDPSKSRFRDADRRGEQLSTKDKITTLDNSIKFQNQQLERIKEEIEKEQDLNEKAELKSQKRDIEYIIRRDEQLKSEYEIASGNNAAQQGHGKRNRSNASVTPPAQGKNPIPAPGEIGPPPPPPMSEPEVFGKNMAAQSPAGSKPETDYGAMPKPPAGQQASTPPPPPMPQPGQANTPTAAEPPKASTPPPPPYPGADPKDQAAKSNAQQQVDQQVESMKGSISTDSDDKTAGDNKKPNKTPKNPSMTRGGGSTRFPT